MKRTKRKTRIFTITIAAVFIFIIISCEDRSIEPEIGENDVKWKEQLDLALTDGNKALKESNLKILGYKVIGKLRTNKEIVLLKNEFLSDSQPLPLYSPTNFKKLSLVSIGDINQKKIEASKMGISYDIPGTEKFLARTLKVGQKIIEIEWNNRGELLTTKAVVDHNGLVYDNILTNTFLVKKNVEGDIQQPMDVQPSFNIDECIPMPPYEIWQWPQRRTISKHFIADWLWGTERGSAKVSHMVEGYTTTAHGYEEKYLTCSSVEATSYMSLGTAGADIKIHTAEYGLRGYSRTHWGLFLASPTITVIMNYSQGGFSIQVSGGIGSELHHTGSQHFSALSW